jgi:hypothetical protein
MVRGWWIAILTLCATACSSGWDCTSRPEPRRKNTVEETKLLLAAENHVNATRGWPRDAYFVEIKQPHANVANVWVIHKEAARSACETATEGNDGKSFAIEMNAATAAVIRELGFQ